ncbi:NYN domain-containing protein [Candidatus Gottesmanbacteria bacterium]|nr:NYN domain-containing protein [Candidatus Gottesmanbacteria bacterium]
MKRYVFIDSQNLNLGVLSLGWKLDFRKFYIYLKDKYKIKKAIIFIGYIKENQNLYKKLKSFGYDLVFKPTLRSKKEGIKGNVDADLVLHAAKIEYKNYDEAIIVSGDGDFCCLHEDLEKERKLFKIIVPSRKGESSLLKRFRKYKLYVAEIRPKVERK